MKLSSGTVDDVTRLGAAEIAHRVSSGELSARDVVGACINRIERVNGCLNALAVPLFEHARAAATAADAARDRGDALGPLHGVPVTIKEMFEVVETPTTAGVTGWAVKLAEADGPLVGHLRRREAAELILANEAPPVFRFRDAMCEPATHRDWAELVLARAALYGVVGRGRPGLLG